MGGRLLRPRGPILVGILLLAAHSHALPSSPLSLSARPAAPAAARRGEGPLRSDAMRLRGGAGALGIPSFVDLAQMKPEKLFNTYLSVLAVTCAGVRLSSRDGASAGQKGQAESKESSGVKSLQRRFLAVFWLFKFADWLHGPYFYQVYASKTFNGAPMTQAMISKLFLCGFGASMLFGTFAGTLTDSAGRKKGCLAFAAMYALSALSTRSNSLAVLILGRILGGTATSLLFSAPEAWLVSEHEHGGYDGAALGEIFGWAYFGDGLAAILAGKLAGAAVGRAEGKGAWLSGPSAPFELSVVFLALGAALVARTWTENKGTPAAGKTAGLMSSLRDGWGAIMNDRRILYTGMVQSLFEGAMYIFVLQWPPAIQSVLGSQPAPYGTMFACLMTACMVGSSLFGLLLKRSVRVETSMSVMLGTSAAALALASKVMSQAPGPNSVHLLSLAFFIFEAGVGLYFPSIGTLRSKYVPDAQKGAILSVFRIPLNLIVIIAFMSAGKLGVSGALAVSATTLLCACLAQVALSKEGLKHDAAKRVAERRAAAESKAAAQKLAAA